MVPLGGRAVIGSAGEVSVRALIPLLALGLLPGCFASVGIDATGGGTADPDSDLDGLPDSQEAELGSDPANADSDGDTYSDGDELAANSDLLDSEHHPYTGGWPIGACRTDIVATGKEEGDVDDNFKLLDQHGDTVQLYDFCDRTVYLLFAAFW